MAWGAEVGATTVCLTLTVATVKLSGRPSRMSGRQACGPLQWAEGPASLPPTGAGTGGHTGGASVMGGPWGSAGKEVGLQAPGAGPGLCLLSSPVPPEANSKSILVAFPDQTRPIHPGNTRRQSPRVPVRPQSARAPAQTRARAKVLGAPSAAAPAPGRDAGPAHSSEGQLTDPESCGEPACSPRAALLPVSVLSFF